MDRFIVSRYGTLTAVAALLWVSQTIAPSAAPSHAPLAQAELHTDVTEIAPGQTFTLAVRMVMGEHVHIYWKNPGDAGLEPKLRWTLPPGFEVSDIHWPYPKRFAFGEFQSFGYADEAWLLLEVQAPQEMDGIEAIRLKARADWLACTEECVPESDELSLVLPVAEPGRAAGQSASAGAIHQAWEQIPVSNENWKAAIAQAKGGEGWQLEATAPEGVDLTGRDFFFFPEPMGVVEPGGDQSPRLNGNGTLSFRLTPASGQNEPPAQLTGVLVGHPTAQSQKTDVLAVRLTARTASPSGPPVR